MRKIFFAILLASITLAACTKEDPTAWIDHTTWKYLEKNSEGYKIECRLTLRNNGGLYYYNGFPPSYGYAYDEKEYAVTSYTYDGNKSGTINLRGNNYHTQDGTATFTLNYNNEKMTVSAPFGTYTLERTN